MHCFTSIMLVLLCTLALSSSSPVPNTNIFSVFYDKPQLNALQGKLIQIKKPQPIVDTITDAEKCCNTQQHLVGKKLLGAYETLSSALANVAEVPKATADKVGATVTNVLNNVGGKIVGLQK